MNIFKRNKKLYNRAITWKKCYQKPSQTEPTDDTFLWILLSNFTY